MHDKLRIVRKHEKNKRDGKSDLPELKIKASRSAHASPPFIPIAAKRRWG